MKKVKLSEESYKKLVNEISYGTVDRAYSRANDLFWDVRTSFDDFYNALQDAIYNTKYNSEEGEETNNPYLEKIMKLSEPIYDILIRKGNQQDNFFDSTSGSIDHNKFYMSDDAEENNIDDMDLDYLQKKYPKDNSNMRFNG